MRREFKMSLSLLTALLVTISSCSSSQDETVDEAGMESSGDETAASVNNAAGAPDLANAPSNSGSVNDLGATTESGAEDSLMNDPLANAAPTNAAPMNAVENAIPVNSTSNIVPVVGNAAALATAAPLNNSPTNAASATIGGVPTGQSVLYVKSDGAAVTDKPNGASSRTMEQGDHFLGSVEGNHARIGSNEAFVSIDQLTTSAVPRGYKASTWKNNNAKPAPAANKAVASVSTK